MRAPLFVFLPLVALQAQTYAIHMQPPVSVGQKYSITSSGSMQEKTASAGQVMKSADYSISFQGKAEVLAVDQVGRPYKLAMTVEKFLKSEGGATTDLLPAGSVVVTDGSVEQPISLRGGVLEDSVREAFAVVFSTHKPDDVTDDEIFGSREAKAVGDSWPMNVASAAENVKGAGIVLPVASTSGSVSLVAKEKLGAMDCLSLRGEMKASEIGLKNLPPGLTLDRGSLRVSFRGCVPVADAGLSHKEGTDVNMEVHLSSPGGAIDVTNVQTTDSVWIAEAK
jgi:hypothetical protein